MNPIPKTVGILVFKDVEELDFVGPWEMLRMWGLYADGPKDCLIVAESREPVLCAKGMSVNPRAAFAECPALQVLLVPGGQGTRQEVHNRLLVDFVARQGAGCQAVLSVCTGSFVLHAAGLLSGKKATTHWGALPRLRALGDVDVVEERFVRDGKVWSSAGVSAGIDMTLAYIADVAGEEAAGKVQSFSEYYPDGVRYGNFAQQAQAPAYIKRG
jgi:transcriptional regulator GlxA family with amidase domain